MEEAGENGLVARILTDVDMCEGELLPFARGEVALYSARSPEKEGKNEDAAALILIDSEHGVLAVADGVGGQAGGESAAEIALLPSRECGCSGGPPHPDPAGGDSRRGRGGKRSGEGPGYRCRDDSGGGRDRGKHPAPLPRG